MICPSGEIITFFFFFLLSFIRDINSAVVMIADFLCPSFNFSSDMKLSVVESSIDVLEEEEEDMRLSESQHELNTPYLCSSNLSSLLDCAKRIAGTEDYLTLVVVREEYDMFSNHICHLQAVFNQSHYLPVLVLTDNVHLLQMIFPFGLIFSDVCDTLADWEEEMDTFLLLEDRLHICRIRLLMELLKSGINVVLSDVDSIWLSNPFDKLPFGNKPSLVLNNDASNRFSVAFSSNTFDIAVLLEKRHILFSFLITRSSSRSMLFWPQIINSLHLLYNESYHSSTKVHSGNAINEVSIKTEVDFFSFFQRVLDYYFVSDRMTITSSHINIFILPNYYFSSAFSYYLERSSISTAAIVINNYAAGNEYTKFYRLVKYNQWLFMPSSHRPSAKSLLSSYFHSRFCVSKGSHSYRHPFHQQSWEIFSDYSYYDFAGNNVTDDILYVRVDSPYHNQIVSKDTQIHIFAVVEGNVSIDTRLINNRDSRVSPIDTYFNSDPLYGFSRSAGFHVSPPQMGYTLSSFSFLVPSTSLQVSVDVLVSPDLDLYCPSFGVDYSNCSLEKGEENILRANAVCRKYSAVKSTNSSDSSFASCGFDLPLGLQKELNQSKYDADSTLPVVLDHEISFSIKVLAYNRIASLQRLLSSLISADYGGYRNISLEILIDRSPASLVLLALYPFFL
jgi:hypothetical protein